MTLIEMSGQGRMIIAAGVLTLAGLKARVILSFYLQLRTSRFWTRAFDLADVAVNLESGADVIVGESAELVAEGKRLDQR